MFGMVEFLLDNRTWSKTCLRENIADPEDLVLSKNGKFRRVALMSNNVAHKIAQDRLLRKALSEIAPEWWGEDTQITVNKNVECKPHMDKNNAEYSYICFLGDYSGGALVFETGEIFDTPGQWHRIDANKLRHWNEPNTSGTKYSVIIYKRGDKPPHRIRRKVVEPA